MHCSYAVNCTGSSLHAILVSRLASAMVKHDTELQGKKMFFLNPVNKWQQNNISDHSLDMPTVLCSSPSQIGRCWIVLQSIWTSDLTPLPHNATSVLLLVTVRVGHTDVWEISSWGPSLCLPCGHSANSDWWTAAKHVILVSCAFKTWSLQKINTASDI